MKPLTERQRLVMQKLGAGMQTKAVAAELGVSVQAVNKSCVLARRKLQLPTHTALIAYAAVESNRA